VSGTTTVTASASDAVGVTKVDFYLDGSLIASDTTAPYSFGWTTTASSNGSHSLQTKAYDAAGNVGTSSTVTVTVANSDSTAPSTPSNLQAQAASPTSVSLTWAASTDNVAVTSYLIQRNGAVIATVSGSSLSYTDPTVVANTTYSYQVLARDAAGNTSSASTAASLTTPAAPDTTPPSAPTNLTATATAATQVNLAWSAVSDPSGIARYDIYRNGSLLSSSLTTSFADGTAVASTSYSYTVKAVDGAGNTSAASNTASVTTPAPSPPTQTLSLSLSDDATIAQSTPTTNFGNNAQVKSDASPEQHGLYKFTVAGVGTKRVTSAKLRLYVADGSDQGGKLYRLTSSNWSQSTVTYATRPRVYTGFPITTIGATTAGSWVEVDLTSLITGNGPYGLQLTTPSSNTAGYASRETATKPVLVVEVR
jgi:chitodextrinase